MKRFVWFVLCLSLAIGVIIALGQAQDQTPAWSFTVEASDDGWVMTCGQGCAWQRLTFSCDAAPENCRVRIDQFGVTVE